MARVHEVGQYQNAVVVLSAGLVPSEEKPPKLLEHLGLNPTQDVDIFVGQLEGHLLLQLNTLPWRITQEEPKVDMDD
jgi:hypothetical protein